MEPKIFSSEMSMYIKRRLLIGQVDWDWLRGLLLPSVVFKARSKLQALKTMRIKSFNIKIEAL